MRSSGLTDKDLVQFWKMKNEFQKKNGGKDEWNNLTEKDKLNDTG